MLRLLKKLILIYEKLFAHLRQNNFNIKKPITPEISEAIRTANFAKLRTSSLVNAN